jgi:hypothetical protein
VKQERTAAAPAIIALTVWGLGNFIVIFLAGLQGIPTPFTSVLVRDAFWLPRLETNRSVSIPSIFEKCEESGRIGNFRRAAGLMEGPYRGSMPFDDTEVYKAIEGASYSLAQAPDPELDAYLDGVISIIEAAQEPDGYLYTNRTIDPSNVHPFAGPTRWSSLVMSHELYNCGHLYEAASAHYLATGKRDLLDVALRNAELVLREFGPSARHDVCGHQIVELGLARLYRTVHDRRYLEEARFFLEERGRHETRPLYMYEDNPGYCQDHLPVTRQTEAVGHAVRAMYMYCGMADVAALLPDPSYAAAIESVWRDVVDSKIYLTGGLGARHKGEAFGDAYELPNATAYAETCAAIGAVMWNHRLFLLTGEARYVDVLEQTLYNGVLSGVSLSGREFFYTNPLESDGLYAFNHGSAGRREWFDVSCCPTSLCRFLPSLSGYVYSTAGSSLYVNLFIANEAQVEVEGSRIGLRMETAYPWAGDVRITISLVRTAHAHLCVRIPGWCTGSIMGGNLYRFESGVNTPATLKVNGTAMPLVLENGYAVIDRDWNDGDAIELSLPLLARKVLCDPRVLENRGKAALQRGPLVYCVEARDSDVPLDALSLGAEVGLTAAWRPDLLGGVMSIESRQFRAVPYYSWANRGIGPMRVWLRG